MCCSLYGSNQGGALRPTPDSELATKPPVMRYWAEVSNQAGSENVGLRYYTEQHQSILYHFNRFVWHVSHSRFLLCHASQDQLSNVSDFTFPSVNIPAPHPFKRQRSSRSPNHIRSPTPSPVLHPQKRRCWRMHIPPSSHHYPNISVRQSPRPGTPSFNPCENWPRTLQVSHQVLV